MSQIAVLIPCYNEAQTIQRVIEEYRAQLPAADIYVYDNNSTDGTDEIARRCGAMVRYEYRQGKGHVIRSMFRDIDADCYIMTDGDDTYPADKAGEMAAMVLERGVDMVVGDRLSSTYFTENKRAFHGAGNRVVRKLVNWLFRGDVADIMTGSRAFSPLFVKSFPILSSGFEIETEMTIHALDKNLSVQSLAVGYRDRPAGSESKLHTVADGVRVIKTIVKLFKNYRPLAFFAWIALVLFLVGAGFFVPVFVEYLNTGLVSRFPTLFSSIGVWIVSILMLVCGLILDTISQHEKQGFEIQLNIIKMLMRK